MSTRARSHQTNIHAPFVWPTLALALCVYPALRWVLPAVVEHVDYPLGSILAAISRGFAPWLAIAALISWFCGFVQIVRKELNPAWFHGRRNRWR